MMVKPTVTELLEKIDDNRYSLVIMTSKRARQIAEGAQVLTKSDDKSVVTLAAEEIADGKVRMLTDEEIENGIVEEKNEEESVEESTEKTEEEKTETAEESKEEK